MAKKKESTPRLFDAPKIAQELKLEGVQNLYNFLFEACNIIRDHEVRAIWDEEKSLWWFSIVDIVGTITDSPSPRKYWSVLKTRLKKAGNELTTGCSQLKMTAADGKQYATTFSEYYLACF